MISIYEIKTIRLSKKYQFFKNLLIKERKTNK